MSRCRMAVPDFLATWNSGKYALGVGQNTEVTPYDWYSSWFAANARQNPSGYESPELKAALTQRRLPAVHRGGWSVAGSHEDHH